MSSASQEKSSTISPVVNVARPVVRERRGVPRGQSFIEAMVAISVIVTSISSSLALVQSSITATTNSGTQVVAANLAREGLEVVRAARDTNWLKSRSFESGLVDPSGNKTVRPLLNVDAGAWTLSFTATTLASANAAVYLTTSGMYLQADAQPSGSEVSPYSRIVSLQYICRVNASGVERAVGGVTTCLASETLVGLLVGSSVRWRGVGGQYQTLTVEERLYDWR